MSLTGVDVQDQNQDQESGSQDQNPGLQDLDHDSSIQHQHFENWVLRHLETMTRVSRTTTLIQMYNMLSEFWLLVKSKIILCVIHKWKWDLARKKRKWGGVSAGRGGNGRMCGIKLQDSIQVKGWERD